MDIKEIPDSIKERAQACKSPEELLALAKEEGYDLSEGDLDAVSGGAWNDPDNHCNVCYNLEHNY